jgi:hypothetical protein
MNLQSGYELRLARNAEGGKIARRVRVMAAERYG